MRINFSVDSLDFGDLGKQMRHAAAVALTRTAQRVQTTLQAEMKGVFDRPTPFTLGSVAVQPATKDNLTSEVFLRQFAAKGSPAADYLHPQIFGGSRKLKRFERSLTSAGLLPSGHFAVPGAAAQLDDFGNMSRGQLVKILSTLRASRDPSQNASSIRRSRGVRVAERYFVAGAGPGEHLEPGIYRRDGNTIRPVVIYVDRIKYSKLFDFYGVCERTAATVFGEEFDKAFDEAMKTAW